MRLSSTCCCASLQLRPIVSTDSICLRCFLSARKVLYRQLDPATASKLLCAHLPPRRGSAGGAPTLDSPS